jgi:hypothetical protein
VIGLRACGGFEVDITWQNLMLHTAEIHSLLGNTCRIRSTWPITVTGGAQDLAVQSPGENLYEFPTEAGRTYTVTAYSCTAPIPSDLDDDCQVDFLDYAVFTDAWDSNSIMVDINGDTQIDFYDLAQLVEEWLTCNRDPNSVCWQ